MVWSATTRRLLGGPTHGERMLSLVAMYMCLWDADRLLHGMDGSLQGDAEARADFPLDRSRFRKVVERYQRIRDSVLHLSDRTTDGHGWTWSVTTAEPTGRFTVAVATSDGVQSDTVTRLEMEGLLDQLDPWLHRHWQRYVDEWALDDGPDPVGRTGEPAPTAQDATGSEETSPDVIMLAEPRGTEAPPG